MYLILRLNYIMPSICLVDNQTFSILFTELSRDFINVNDVFCRLVIE